MHRDEDQSGSSRNRPQIDNAIQRILTGEADAIIVRKLSRFSRNWQQAADDVELLESDAITDRAATSKRLGDSPGAPAQETALSESRVHKQPSHPSPQHGPLPLPPRWEPVLPYWTPGDTVGDPAPVPCTVAAEVLSWSPDRGNPTRHRNPARRRCATTARSLHLTQPRPARSKNPLKLAAPTIRPRSTGNDLAPRRGKRRPHQTKYPRFHELELSLSAPVE